MNAKPIKRLNSLSGIAAIGLFLLSSCNPNNQSNPIEQGFEVKFLVGSALEQFCNQAATQFNQQKPKLDNGKVFYLKCEAKGSGDVVNSIVVLSKQLLF